MVLRGYALRKTISMRSNSSCLEVDLRERLHATVNFLSFTREPKALQELPQRVHEKSVRKVEGATESMQHCGIERLSVT